jgi:hypothetical protein
MGKIILTAAALGLLTIISCGPSKEEKAALEKAKMDSVALATRRQIETKYALQDSIKSTRTYKEQMEIQLTESKANLEAAIDKMGRIKEWQFGRTAAEREQQIKDQTYRIDRIEKEIDNLKIAIQNASQQIADFQTELNKYK